MKRRGKSEVGEKTMLDVLVPAQGAARGRGRGLAPDQILGAGARTPPRTASLQPSRCRRPRDARPISARRSIGHLDPGAQSSALLIAAVCDVLEREA